MPLLSAIAARTKNIEVGTGVIDMRYENPLHLAEESAALDLIADGRIALGVSRGAPEAVERGWEAFGHTGSTDPRGADIAREHFLRYLAAIREVGMATAHSAEKQYPHMYTPSASIPVLPHSPNLDRRVWWGAGTRETAKWAGQVGVNLMSSTLLTESNGDSFGRTYIGEPDQLIADLLNDAAVAAADTLMLTIPNQLGVEANVRLLKNFATHVAPSLGWEPSTAEDN